MSETNLGVVEIRGGKDGYIITNEYWSYLANGFREMGLLVRTLPEEKAFVTKKLDIMSVRLITSYSATYPYTVKHLKKYTRGTAIALIVLPLDDYSFADLLSIYAAVAVGGRALREYGEWLEKYAGLAFKDVGELGLSPKHYGPLAALYTAAFGEMTGDRIEIYFKSPIWYSIYRKFLRRYTRHYCGKMWCGLSVKREEGGAALRELVWRYLGKPPPLTPLLKWLGEDYA